MSRIVESLYRVTEATSSKDRQADKFEEVRKKNAELDSQYEFIPRNEVENIKRGDRVYVRFPGAGIIPVRYDEVKSYGGRWYETPNGHTRCADALFRKKSANK